MGIPLAAVGGKVTAALFNLVVKQVNALALTGQVPTSVAGTGVTVSPGGAVTFVNSTAVSINGVFTGDYENYRIIIQSNNRSTGSSTQFHLRAAGADIGSGYAFVKSVSAIGGSAPVVTSSGSATAVPLDDGLAAGQITTISIDLTYPSTAAPTIGTSNSTTVTSSMSTCQIGIANFGTTAVDGFSIYPLTGGATFSGVVRVYGYNSLA